MWGCASVSTPLPSTKERREENVLLREELCLKEVKADALGARLAMKRVSGCPLPPTPIHPQGAVARLFSPEPWVPPLFQRAYLEMVRGNGVQARTLFRSFVRARPHHPLADDALYYVALMEEAKGLRTQAIYTLKALSALYPQADRISQVKLKMGLILLEEGRIREGERALEQVMAGLPFTLGWEEGEALLKRGEK